MKRGRRLLVITSVCFALLSLVASTTAQGTRRWEWQRWDVRIDRVDTSANSFHVAETQVIAVTSGAFIGGDRGVSLDRVTGIENVTVTDGSTALREVSATSAENCPLTGGIFCLFITPNNEVDIYYNFLSRTSAGQTRTITIEYDVHGALRSYPERDQLWWSPVASLRDFPVLASRVVVEMPVDRPPLGAQTYGAYRTIALVGNTVTVDSKGLIKENDRAEIQVFYAHDPAMSPPPWQAATDGDSFSWLRLCFGPAIVLLPVTMFVVGGALRRRRPYTK
jgi:Predicted membrane protein (DUF2207)